MANSRRQIMDSDHPTWLHDGQERCVFCDQVYLLEMELRCVECDESICPLCVIEITGRREVWCPACRSASNASD